MCEPGLPVYGNHPNLLCELVYKMTVAGLGGHSFISKKKIEARVVKPRGHRPRSAADVCGNDRVNASKHLNDGNKLLPGRVCNVRVGVLIAKRANSGLSTNYVTDAGGTVEKDGSTPRSPSKQYPRGWSSGS